MYECMYEYVSEYISFDHNKYLVYFKLAMKPLMLRQKYQQTTREIDQQTGCDYLFFLPMVVYGYPIPQES